MAAACGAAPRPNSESWRNLQPGGWRRCACTLRACGQPPRTQLHAWQPCGLALSRPQAGSSSCALQLAAQRPSGGEGGQGVARGQQAGAGRDRGGRQPCVRLGAPAVAVPVAGHLAVAAGGAQGGSCGHELRADPVPAPRPRCGMGPLLVPACAIRHTLSGCIAMTERKQRGGVIHGTFACTERGVAADGDKAAVRHRPAALAPCVCMKIAHLTFALRDPQRPAAVSATPRPARFAQRVQRSSPCCQRSPFAVK